MPREDAAMPGPNATVAAAKEEVKTWAGGMLTRAGTRKLNATLSPIAAADSAGGEKAALGMAKMHLLKKQKSKSDLKVLATYGSALAAKPAGLVKQKSAVWYAKGLNAKQKKEKAAAQLDAAVKAADEEHARQDAQLRSTLSRVFTEAQDLVDLCASWRLFQAPKTLPPATKWTDAQQERATLTELNLIHPKASDGDGPAGLPFLNNMRDRKSVV